MCKVLHHCDPQPLEPTFPNCHVRDIVDHDLRNKDMFLGIIILGLRHRLFMDGIGLWNDPDVPDDIE